MKSREDIYVVGMHAFLAGAEDIADMRSIFINQQRIVPDFPQLQNLKLKAWSDERAFDFETAVGLKGLFHFDHLFFGMTPRDAAMSDPQQRKLLESVVQCFSDAGMGLAETSATTEIGLFVGAGTSNYLDAVKPPPTKYFSEATRRYISSDVSSLALRTAHLLDLRGPAMCVLSTCSSALYALKLATDYLASGQGTFAVAAGAFIDFESGWYNAEAGGILSPTNTCRPLSERADGTYFSHGLGTLLLCSVAATREYGLVPYCRVLGAAVNNDGRRKAGYTAPSASGQAAVIRKALLDAEMRERPDIVELHGTGTLVGDPIEIEGLAAAYDGLVQQEPTLLGSSKSNFGHLNATAGLLGAIKAAISLDERTFFASVDAHPLNSALPLSDGHFSVPEQSVKISVPCPTYVVSSFGIGGTNVHVIFGADQAKAEVGGTSSTTCIVWVGGLSPAHLSNQTEMLSAFVCAHDPIDPLAMAFSCRSLFGRDKNRELILLQTGKPTVRLAATREDLSVEVAGQRLDEQAMATLISQVSTASRHRIHSPDVLNATIQGPLGRVDFTNIAGDTETRVRNATAMLISLFVSLEASATEGLLTKRQRGLRRAFSRTRHVFLPERAL